uniref:Immunoglobulin domain-containing protein n=1 Tax=Oncorhynchus mykiss TaxID=8022 RepID=A0A8C7NDK4_ONCMY
MAPHLLLVLHIIFFLTGLSGTQSVSTVRHVSVKQGGSITIPCPYDQKYRNNVKYWCRGPHFLFCYNLICTKSKSTSDWLSISDNVTTCIFTLTMNNLKPGVSDYFWCAVENVGPDERSDLYLSVTTGIPGLYVDQQQVTGIVGGSVIVNCYGNYGAISFLHCALGDLLITVRKTVSQRTTKQNPNTITSMNTHHCACDYLYILFDCILYSSFLEVLFIPLSLLVVAIAGILITWKMPMVKQFDVNKVCVSFLRTSADSEQDITYSTVSHTRGTAQQVPLPDDAVTYSTVVTKNKTHQNVEPDKLYGG